MIAYDRKKNTFFKKILCVFKQKRADDIVSYADRILDDYTGVTRLRSHKAENRRKKAYIICLSLCFAVFIAILGFSFKIFF